MMFTDKVLIADDEAHIRKFVGLILKRLGATTIMEASDGEQTIEMYKAESPQLLLLDVNMPKLDGLEVLQQVMAFDPHAIVVMLTSVANRQTVEECARLGATDFIRKDMPRDELSAALQRIIDEAGSTEESTS